MGSQIKNPKSQRIEFGRPDNVIAQFHHGWGPKLKILNPNEPLLDQPDSVSVQHGGGGGGEIHFGLHPSLTGEHAEDGDGDDDLSGLQRKIHFSACLGSPPRELCLYWRTEVQEFSG